MALRLSVGIYIVLVYATIPFARDWQRALRALAGGDFNLWMNATLVLAGLFMTGWGLRALQGRRLRILAGLMISVLLFAFQIDIPEERVHLLEYAGLGYLLAYALQKDGRGSFYMTVPLAGFVIGLGDETLQGFFPNRVFDWYDVGLNTIGILIGLAVAVLSRTGGRASHPEKSGPGRANGL